MNKFNNLSDFVKAVKRASEGDIDSRLIPNNKEQYLTEKELEQMEEFADGLLKPHPQKRSHKPTQ